jgi:hypothetical protein
MPDSHQSPGAWQTAATASVVWQALAPARRIWMSAEAAVSRAVTSRDSDGSEERENKEARTTSMVRSSRLVRVLDRLLDTAFAAWRDSVAGVISRQMFEGVKERTLAERLRLAGGVTAVAAATALAMQRLAPRPTPFMWIVPALFLLVGVCLIALAWERPAR